MSWDAVSKIKLTFQGFSNEVTTNTLAIGLVICIAVYWWMPKRKYNLPPGPTGLPILGYLPFLGKEPYKDFERLCKEYGNVLGLYMGQTYVVVLGDYEAAKEGLNQTPLLARPVTQFDFNPDGGGFSSANTSEWTEQRRFAIRIMRDIGLGGSKWETLIQDEIDDVVRVIEKQNGAPANFQKLLSESVSNNITTLVLGRRLLVGDPARQLANRVVDLIVEAADIGNYRNFFPAAARFLAKFGVGNQSKDLHGKLAEFADFLKTVVDERKKVYKDEESDIFVDVYLKEIENNLKEKLNNHFTERNLRGNMSTLLAAGSDTTAVSLQWLLLAMAQFPEIQEKVHQELDAVLGKSGKAKYSERSKLPYTYAVLQESSRWITITPLSVARVALEDTKINGYDIPKGTFVFPNLYAIHKNSKYWKEPAKFIPERFLNEDCTPIASKIDGFIPFSYGKRNCPGEAVAKIAIFMYFAAIMQRFGVLPPDGKAPKLEGKSGLTYRPPAQELRLVPRY